MKFLVQASKATKGIEIGTFTGYSAFCLAEGLPENGKLLCLDPCVEYWNVGVPFLKKAGLWDKVEFRQTPALPELDKILKEGKSNETYDFAYIDADKENYSNYVQRLKMLLKPEGFIMLDNTIWRGAVADPEIRSKDP
jgi:predicted O-methyltransferase YrrM